MPTSSPINPYEPPREATNRPDFADKDAAELADLRRRVAELERRLGRNWLVHPNSVFRICGVWGYFLMGYAFMGAIVGLITLVFMAMAWLIRGSLP